MIILREGFCQIKKDMEMYETAQPALLYSFNL